MNSISNRKEVQADDAAFRDEVYSRLLRALPLSGKHRSHLLGRGFTSDEIERLGYASLGANPVVNGNTFSGIDRERIVKTVPGFDYSDRGPAAVRVTGRPGLLIPQRNVAVMVQGIKDRLDWPRRGENGKLEGKYKALSTHKGRGPSASALIHVSIGAPIGLEVRLCEGEIKADFAAFRTGVLTISFPGAQSWRLVIPFLLWLTRLVGPLTVRVAFDADSRTNKDVAVQLVKCLHHLHASGFRMLLEVWPAECGKGIDDVLAAGHVSKIRTLDRDEWQAEVERIAVPLVGQLRFEELLDEARPPESEPKPKTQPKQKKPRVHDAAYERFMLAKGRINLWPYVQRHCGAPDSERRYVCPTCKQRTLTLRTIAERDFRIPGVECSNRDCLLFDVADIDAIEFIRRARGGCSFDEAGRELGISEELLDAFARSKQQGKVDFEEIHKAACEDCQYRDCGFVMIGPEERGSKLIEVRGCCHNRRRCLYCRSLWIGNLKRQFDAAVKHHGLTKLFRHECDLAEANAVRQKLGRIAGKLGVDPLWDCIRNTRAAQPLATFFSTVPFDAADEEIDVGEARKLFVQALEDTRGVGRESHSDKWMPKDADDDAGFELLGKNRSQMKHWKRTAVRWGIWSDGDKLKYMRDGARGFDFEFKGSREEKIRQVQDFVDECEVRQKLGDVEADQFGTECDAKRGLRPRSVDPSSLPLSEIDREAFEV